MRRHIRELSILHQTALAGAEAESVDDLVARVTDILAKDLYPEAVGFLFVDFEQQCLQLHPSYHGIETDDHDLTIPLGEGMGGTVAQTGEPLLIPDMTESSHWIAHSCKVQSGLYVPVRTGGQVIGVIGAASEQRGAFSKDDLHLLSAVAGQVGSALERLQLFQEARRRTSELEALREVSLEITAQLELPSLLEGIVRRAAELLDANGGGLYLYHPEEEELELVVSYSLETDYTGARLEVGQGLSGRVVASGQPIIVDDYHSWEGRAPVYEETPFTAVVGVPLRWQDRIVGVINVTNLRERRPFGEQDLYLLEAFAQQAAIAIQNARLFEEARQHAEELQLLFDLTRDASASLDLDEVLERVAAHLCRAAKATSGHILILDESGERATVRAQYWSREASPRERTPDIGTVYDLTRHPVILQALQQNRPLITHVDDPDLEPETREMMTDFDGRSALRIPMFVTGVPRAYALIWETRRHREWTEKEVDLCQILTHQAAVAIENARLFEMAERRAAELETLRRVSLSLTASLKLETVLDAILRGTFELLTGVQNAHIFLYQAEDDRLIFGSARWSNGHTGQPFSEPRPDGLTYTVAREGEPVAVSDMRSHPLFADAPPDWKGAIIGLPLKIGQSVVGVMNVAYSKPHAFSEAELRILRLLSDQAALAVENAQLHRGMRSRVEEANALLEIAQAVTSTMDLTQLLRQIALRTAQICRANRCSILLIDPSGERLEPIMSQFADGHTKPELWHLFRTTGPDWVDDVPLFRQVVRQRRPAVIEDVARKDDVLPRKWTEPFGIQTLMAVPLISRDRAIGVMVLDHEAPAKRFSQGQVDLAEMIASHVAVSIENARLFEAEQMARRRAETLQKAATVLNSTLELEELLDVVLEELEKVVPYDSASVQLLRDEELEIIAGRGFRDPEKVMGLTFSAADEPDCLVIAEKRPLLIPNVRAAYDDFAEEPHTRIRSWLGAPLLSKGEVVGMITLDRTEVNAFSEEEADIALAFANHVAIALENARLYEATRQQAITDGLTGLYNVRRFYQVLEKELKRSQRYGHPCSLLMLDLDDFKGYNDRYGHLAGDDLLRELADLMRSEIRQADTAARYGGEEFVIILPETGSTEAEMLADRLRKTVKEHEFSVRKSRQVGRVTISVGVAVYPEDAQDVEGLVDRADMALLCAKEAKDQVCLAAEVAV